MKRFGEKLRTLRKKRGLTLRGLAEMLEVSHPFIVQLEKGERHPNAEMIIKIADVFGVCTDQLMRDEVALDVGEDEEA